MKIKIQKISGRILLALLLITLVLLGMFFFGGEADAASRVVADAEMSQPAYTDAWMYWMYILLGITICVTLVAAILKLVGNFIDSPMAALKSLAGIIALVVVLGVTWAMGSEEPLVLPGYDGTDNVPFWLKLTDMFLYSIYFMVGTLVVLIIGFSVRKKFL
ncbi:MAG: hypothetical protein ACI36X_00050 [Bacteroidaceae bacterium]